MAPSILYHSVNPALYPSPSSVGSPQGPSTAQLDGPGQEAAGQTLLVVRFTGPVRISSVRIIPEGVRCFNDVGTTYPPAWTGEILLNVSPSNPVNALVRTSIDVISADHALDYAISMPAGVTTRMMMLRSPAQRLTLSIYGYAGDDLTMDEQAGMAGAQPEDLILQPMEEVNKTQRDFTWIYGWAAKSTGTASPVDLIALLRDTTPVSVARRAIDCLDLLVELSTAAGSSTRNSPLGLLDELVSRSEAISYLFSRAPDSALAARLLADPSLALHPSVSPYLPQDHPWFPLVQAGPSARHQAAWANLHLGQAALERLGDCTEVELLATERDQTKSNLVRLLGLAEDCAAKGSDLSVKTLGVVLDIVDRQFSDQNALGHLRRTLPKLVVVYNTLTRSTRRLTMPITTQAAAIEILRNLLLTSSEILHGVPLWPAARDLAQGYLSLVNEHDPLRKVFELRSIAAPSPLSSPEINHDADGRRLSRLDRALAQLVVVPPSSSLVHTATPAELLRLVAPALVDTLSTATLPPFGIPSTVADDPSQGAKAFAGKVYTSHEFRRDRGAASGLGPEAANHGVGLGITPGGMGMVPNLMAGAAFGGQTGSGAGVGPTLGGASRPASRHVDSYAG
ncbi:hypothetical protein IAU60_003754 [Kwoniella sp. DSM 27419]